MWGGIAGIPFLQDCEAKKKRVRRKNEKGSLCSAGLRNDGGASGGSVSLVHMPASKNDELYL